MRTNKPTYEEVTKKFIKYLPESFNEKDCWEWKGPMLNCGYGDIEIGSRKTSSHYRERSHRFSFMHFNEKEIPKGMHICHKCDNRKCCNPLHLFMGTAKDNAEDMVKKGRQVKGEDHYCAKIKEETIPKIYEMLNREISGTEIAKKFGLGKGAVSNLVKGKTWKHVKRVHLSFAAQNRKGGAKKLTSSDIKNIFELRAQGETYYAIGDIYGVDHSTIYKIIKRKRWKHLQ